MSAGISRRALLPVAAGLTGAFVLAVPSSSQMADGPPGTTLEPGVHRIDANLTIKGDLLIKPGATIEVAAGRTLTLLGGLVAPIAPIFTGAGAIDLNRSRVAEAYPEWWGAVPGDARTDSLAALRACLRAHPAMRLLAGDYFVSDTWAIDRPFCQIAGAGFRGTRGGQGTRIVVTSDVADVLRVGPAIAPRTVNDFLQNINISGIALCRSAPVDHVGGQAPVGLRAQYLLYAHFEQVSAFEHGIGFVARGLVRSELRDCVAYRSLPGRSAGQPFRGFLLDGSGDIGLAGGNASLYLAQCNATIGGDPVVADGVGLLIEGAFADSFILDFETAGIETGVRIDGQAGMIGGRTRNGHVNLHLRMPILDQCGRVGLDIRDTAAETLIDIGDVYVAVAPSAEAAIRFTAMRGAATITGGQLVGTSNSSAGGKATGLAASDSHGLQVAGLKILDHAQPASLERCSGFSLCLLIANPVSRPGGAGLALRDCGSGFVQPLLLAPERAFADGVRIGGQVRGLRLDAPGVGAQAAGSGVTAAGRPLSAPFRDASLSVEGL